MRSDYNRVRKYASKEVASIVAARAFEMAEEQKRNFVPAIVKQAQIESIVKNIASGTNLVYYIIYGKQCVKIAGKHVGPRRELEISGLKALWISRGLDSDILETIRIRLIGAGAELPPDVQWLEGWTYRRAITISNTGSALSNYQVRIELTSSNFNYSHAKDDGSDLRITKSDKVTNINFWIEKWDSSGTSYLWVKAPSIPSGSSTIYMYYGNSEASSASNGENVFDLFDEFDSLDTTKWTDYNGATVSDGELDLSSTSAKVSSEGKVTFTLSQGLAVEMRMKGNSYTYRTCYMRLYDTDGDCIDTGDTSYYTWGYYASATGKYDLSMQYVRGSTSEWREYRMIVFNTTFLNRRANTLYSDENLQTINKTLSSTTNGRTYYIDLCGGGGSYRGGYIDWVRARKYTSPEPSTAVGAEQTQ